LDSLRETPRETPCKRLLARDSSQETSRERLLGGAVERNNQPDSSRETCRGQVEIGWFGSGRVRLVWVGMRTRSRAAVKIDSTIK
jgi:hypothetical protein